MSQTRCLGAGNCANELSETLSAVPSGTHAEPLRRILIAASGLTLPDFPGGASSLANPVLANVESERVAAASRDDVLSALQSRVFDVLVLQTAQALPDLELIAAVQAQSPDTDVIVLAPIGPDFPYLAVMDSGVRDVIGEPVNAEEFQARLLRVLRERETRNALAQAENKYRSIFEFNVDGMMLLDPKTYQILDSNRAFSELSGHARAALCGKAIMDLLAPNERERFVHGLELCAQNGQGTVGDVSLVDNDGQNLFIDISVTFLSLAAEQLILLAFKDVTEKRLLEQHLADAAQKDDLTGLWNKKTFHLNLPHAVAHARESQMPLCLIFFDVDNFKKCNDTYGHPAGDHILQLVGESINRNIRHRSDQGFRCGGDEFALILNGASIEVSCIIGDRIRQDFAKSETSGATLSAGIVQYKPPMPPAGFAKAADEALYRAKSLGKNASIVG